MADAPFIPIVPIELKSEIQNPTLFCKLVRAKRRTARARDGKVYFCVWDQENHETFYLALDRKLPVGDDDEGDILRQQNLALLARVQTLEKAVAALQK